MDTGVASSETDPEIRMQTLFRDRFIGAVRQGHALTHGPITARRYAEARYILGPRGPADQAPIDEALAALGLERWIATIVTGFASALALVRGSDLVAAVPQRHTDAMREKLFDFVLPVAVPQVTVSLLWHPRFDADSAHRWLRACIRDVCSSK